MRTVKAEVKRLMQAAVVVAFAVLSERRVDGPRVALAAMGETFYGGRLDEILSRLPDYRDGECAEVFVRNLYNALGLEADFERLAMFTAHIREMFKPVVSWCVEMSEAMADRAHAWEE